MSKCQKCQKCQNVKNVINLYSFSFALSSRILCSVAVALLAGVVISGRTALAFRVVGGCALATNAGAHGCTNGGLLGAALTLALTLALLAVVVQVLIATQVVWVRYGTVAETLIGLDTGVGALVGATPVRPTFLAALPPPSIITNTKVLKINLRQLVYTSW